MVYKKVVMIAFGIAVISMILSGFVFGTGVITQDKIYDSVLNVLIFIQKYSWPIMTLVFIYALYEFYVAGSKILEKKFTGQRLIVGIAVFMAIIQCLPLLYAFILAST